MKNRGVALMLAATLLAASPTIAQSKTESIRVSGNCGMCAKKITTAAREAGAKEAKWDRKTKVLTVTYNASKTSNDAIQKKVASVGYDTEKYTADEDVYQALHECCHYENKRVPPETK